MDGLALPNLFSPDEFTVDEKPIEVIQIAADPAGDPPLNGENHDGELPGAGKDVLTILGEMMAGQARLRDEIEKLKTQAPADDEFGRFAKQSVQFLDSMDRMIQMGRAQAAQSEEIKRWLQAVESAFQRLLRHMEKYGLETVSYDGQEVDLASQDVIEYRNTQDYPHNTVIETVLKGIKLRGRVLRDAKVIVACNQ